jgi:hypothetical protein
MNLGDTSLDGGDGRSRAPGSGRGARLTLVALAVLVLLAVVAFATRSGFGGSTDATPSPTYVNYAFSAFLVVFVLAIPATIYAFAIQVREPGYEPPSFISRVLRNLLTLFLIMGIVAGALYLRRHYVAFSNLQIPHLRKPKASGHQGKGGDPQDYQPAFEQPVLWVTIAILVPLAVLAFVTYRRRVARRAAMLQQPIATVADELTREISDAIEDLDRESDPRRAVIAAYARMEGVLARHGLPRRPSETAVEYLGRVLRDLHARAAAVERLTSLFERAKFSAHAIDPEMKRDAIAALTAIRDDLHRGAS